VQSSPRIKVVVCGITALELHFPTLRCASRDNWRKSAHGIHPLDGRHTAQLAASRTPDHRDQQLRDRPGVRRVSLGRHLAGNLAAVIELPCRTAKMLANRFALLVE
jgi:hypothetical protein